MTLTYIERAYLSQCSASDTNKEIQSRHRKEIQAYGSPSLSQTKKVALLGNILRCCTCFARNPGSRNQSQVRMLGQEKD